MTDETLIPECLLARSGGVPLSGSRPGQRWEDMTIEEIVQYVETLSLPGHVYHVFSNELTGAGRVSVWHLVDPEWFGAWVHHPHFHLIK